jgi:hypothetical protein
LPLVSICNFCVLTIADILYSFHSFVIRCGQVNADGGFLQPAIPAAAAQQKSPCLRAEKGERCRGLESSASFRAGSPLVKKVRRLQKIILIIKSGPTLCRKPQI